MEVFVENGLAGCDLARQRETVTLVVDALRASAMVTSLFHYGTQRLLVVREVEEAFAEREGQTGVLLVGERGGPMVPGFDLGNSPLQQAPDCDISNLIFSSSNCSRCCVGVAGLTAFLASTVNATAVARTVLRACETVGKQELVIVTAGSADDESLLTLEDHVAAGAIMSACEKQGATVSVGNDRAEVCRLAFGDGTQEWVTERFTQSQNGLRLARLGLGADVEFASRLDVFDLVVRIDGVLALRSGGRGALLLRHC